MLIIIIIGLYHFYSAIIITDIFSVNIIDFRMNYKIITLKIQNKIQIT